MVPCQPPLAQHSRSMHLTWGIATYMLLWKNSLIASTLEAACWNTHSVFADHYLRDIQRQEGDIFALGPVVATGNIVD